MNYPQYILDTIFPIKCLGCGKLSSVKPDYLCKPCLRKIPTKKIFECIGCKASVSLGRTCLRCKRDTHIDQLLAIYDYSDPIIIKVIKTLKYRFVADIAQNLAFSIRKYVSWLNSEKKFNILDEDPIIIPLPLHYRRLNWRGFNQAELIANFLAVGIQSDIKTDLLIRTSESRPQADIEEKEERLKNLKKNTFKITDKNEVRDRTIILVDDVCTTGATLNECARVLKEAGAKKVIGFVIARG
jgi:ComF family protein